MSKKQQNDFVKKIIDLPTDQKALASIVLAGVSVFLPWIGFGYSANIAGFSGGLNASVSGLSVDGGLVGLLSSIAGIYLFKKQDKWAFVPGAVNLVAGLGYVFNFFGPMSSVGFNYSSSFGSAAASADIKFGLILFVIFSGYYTFITGSDFLENHNNN